MARKKKESKLNMQESFIAHKYNISETTFLQIKSYTQYNEDEKVEDWWGRVEANPYRLMSCEGFGFKRCDIIAQKVNFDMRSPVRINAYVSTAIENDAKGSSIVSFPKIIANIDKDLSINDIELVINSIKHDEDNDYVLLDGRYKLTEDKSTALYLTKKGWYYAEKFCFTWFKHLSKMNKPDVRGVKTFEKYPTLNVEQKYALEHFLDKNITLLIGGSGTGKSYTTKALLDLLDENKYTYKLLAPTGIASINLQQKTGRPCSTIHRTFYQQKDRKLDCDYLVIDELSMLGVDHFNMLSQIVRKNTRVLFIGDKFQLPSISAGDFLGGLMKCLSKGIFDGQILELKTIMRASDETFIPHLCQQFTNHNKFDSSVLYKKHNKVQFIKRKDTLLEDIKYIIDSNGWSFEDTMIISPQRKGELGLVKINNFFQNLNNNVIVYQDKFNTFKQGDYCMHIKNNRMLGIYNGERVICDRPLYEEDTYLFHKIEDGDILSYGKDEVSQVELGYATSVHKTQGITLKNVIFLALDCYAPIMMTSNLVYTGLSRASENLVVFYDSGVLERASYKSLTDKRTTFLGLLADRK